MVKQREWDVRGRWRWMNWRAVWESEKRVIEQVGASVVANLRPSLMAKRFVVRMEAVELLE